ncbi:MAG: biopolymer transporter ExbD [Phycisphaerales bacterium]|nr:biopolymer transporter ExbD [Phycisphaerales bacterium]
MLFKPPRAVSLTLNLAPMVDVMMCLIIFFILAGDIVKSDHRQLDMPFALAAATTDTSRLGPRVVINIVTPPGGGAAEYRVTGWDGEQIVDRVITPDEVAPLLAQRAADARRDGPGDLRCVIRAHRDARYRDVELVLRGCGLAKIRGIVFGVHAGAEPQAGGGS